VRRDLLGSFQQNTLVTLTATESQGSVFSGWSGGGAAAPMSASSR
jgi:hypothetical protein